MVVCSPKRSGGKKLVAGYGGEESNAFGFYVITRATYDGRQPVGGPGSMAGGVENKGGLAAEGDGGSQPFSSLVVWALNSAAMPKTVHKASDGSGGVVCEGGSYQDMDGVLIVVGSSHGVVDLLRPRSGVEPHHRDAIYCSMWKLLLSMIEGSIAPFKLLDVPIISNTSGAISASFCS
ncbi:hypothetical protein AMTR_s00018p00257790 [Amborella trichopoda]|uniref:Uncharacterized protein n=1 Tax=Amborella trichopoda TaxID=13333 RepID=W1PM99_AMBTC|nr:hypothetical protein AMTR_s00018p00257790 [Amborella trichopoda]